MTREFYIIYIILLSLTIDNSFGQKDDELKSIFLNLNYNDKISLLFSDIEVNPNFKLRTTRKKFMKTADFSAKYLTKSDISFNCDSIICRVFSCDDVSTFFKPEAKNCKSIQIQYFFSDAKLNTVNFHKLDSIIQTTITTNIPEWKNHEGVAKGVYFLTDKIYPYIALDTHSNTSNYLTVSYSTYDK
jgi:hypothetical protein